MRNEKHATGVTAIYRKSVGHVFNFQLRQIYVDITETNVPYDSESKKDLPGTYSPRRVTDDARL